MQKSTTEILNITAARELSNSDLIRAGAVYEMSPMNELLLRVPTKVSERIGKVGRVAYINITPDMLTAIEEDFYNWYKNRFNETLIENLTESNVREIIQHIQKSGAIDVVKIERRLPQLRTQTANFIQRALDISNLKELCTAVTASIQR